MHLSVTVKVKVQISVSEHHNTLSPILPLNIGLGCILKILKLEILW